METILLTGLDGSGKSTILRELSKIRNDNYLDVIYLPHIELDSLENDLELKRTVTFVNHLNLFADKHKEPGLKAVAIFSSMVLFKNIFNLLSESGINTIFCERHPLIDTIIYAQFYAQKAGSGSQNLDDLAEIDEKFKDELEYLVQQIPNAFSSEKKASIEWLANFIFKRFFIEKKLMISDLKELFEVDIPDKIYYLKAEAETLYQRLASREILEAHESVEVLEKLATEYDKLFNELNQKNPGLIEIIDATSLSALDKFRAFILKKHKNCTS